MPKRHHCLPVMVSCFSLLSDTCFARVTCRNQGGLGIMHTEQVLKELHHVTGGPGATLHAVWSPLCMQEIHHAAWVK